jgi:hypothetical protein
MSKKLKQTRSRRPVERVVRRLTDWKIATLFLYISEKGLPPWAQGGAAKQASALAMLAGWNGTRAARALREAVEWGCADESGQAQTPDGNASKRKET